MFYYFISDLHLSDERPDITRAFLDFIQTKAPQAKAVYILGDLFEFWNGDDTKGELADSVCQALSELSSSGTQVYFLYGNRDFLAGRKFAKRCKLNLLQQETVVRLFDTDYLLMHGDSLCTDDQDYQRFRRITESKVLRFIYRNLPFSIREKVSHKVRGKSQSDNQYKAAEIMDVSTKTVKQKLIEHNCQALIHGHTHRQAIHALKLGKNESAQRVVLGDWHQQTSILKLSKTGYIFLNQAYNEA